MTDPMHYLYDQRDRSGNSPIDQALARRQERLQADRAAVSTSTESESSHYPKDGK